MRENRGEAKKRTLKGVKKATKLRSPKSPKLLRKLFRMNFLMTVAECEVSLLVSSISPLPSLLQPGKKLPREGNTNSISISMYSCVGAVDTAPKPMLRGITIYTPLEANLQ